MLGIISEDENHNKTFKPMAGATLGQGVPLGAWCSFEKDVAPSNNWLMAGTTFDASVYPALALYLGTNVVPSRYDHDRPSDYESITLSTDSNNPTVMDYDGVLLVKIANPGYNPEIFINNISVGKVGMSSSATGTSFYGNVGTFIFKKGDSIYSNLSDVNITYQVAYYTHPLFIKATSIASDTDQQAILAQIQAYNTYSTEETLTGKTWIDGKPIYRKCFIGVIVSNAILVQNVSAIVNVGGTFKDVNNNIKTFPLEMYDYGDQTQRRSVTINSNNDLILNCAYSNQNYDMWVEYTKTTN